MSEHLQRVQLLLYMPPIAVVALDWHSLYHFIAIINLQQVVRQVAGQQQKQLAVRTLARSKQALARDT